MRDYLSTSFHPLSARHRTRGRAWRRASLIAIGAAALAACGEVVPVNPDAGVPVDALDPAIADLAALDLGAYGELVPAFSPDVTEYRASFSLVVQDLNVTATPVHPGAMVTINGVDVAPGALSDDIPLDPVLETPITIEVRSPSGNTKIYSIITDHAAGIQQRVYGKASNPGGTTDPNDVGDEFAFSLDASDDTIVVGAHLEDSAATTINGDQASEAATNAGAAYVYRRVDNEWVQEAYLKASNTDAFDEFGRAVAIDENVIVVGAPGESSNSAGVDGDESSDGLFAAGAVYVFRRTGSEWRKEAYLKASDPKSGALFGWHVAIDDEVIVVGAPGIVYLDPSEPADDNYPNDGAAYVFRYNGATWVEEQKLVASNAELGDEFGFQVAVDDDIVAVAATSEDSGIGGEAPEPTDNTASMSGAVYAFELQPDGTWAQTDYIKSPDPDGALAAFPDCFDVDECEGDRFGSRIELDDDTLVVGSYREDGAARQVNGDPLDNAAKDSGAAYVFRRGDGGNWTQEAYLKSTNSDPGDFFGNNFGLVGNLLAVAANGESSGATGIGGDATNNDAQSAGAVYLFQRVGVEWQQIEYIKPMNTERFDNFGFNIDISDNMIVIGSVWENGGIGGINVNPSDESQPRSGCFYIFQ
jgi:hypothetical protein